MAKPIDVLKNLSKKVENVTASIDLKFLLEEIPRIIRVRTRLGKGVNGGKLEKLKPLSEDYKDTRKRLKSKLSGETSPNRSGLTATGQMLEAIRGKQSGNTITFTIDGSRTKELSGNSKLSNDEVAKFARETGRPFFELSDSEKNGIQRKVAQAIKKALSKLTRG